MQTKRIFYTLCFLLLFSSQANALFKNVASQKVSVYAYDISGEASQTGAATSITAQISLDGAASVAISDTNPTELDATNQPGIYVFDLATTETNANLIVLSASSSTGGVWIEPISIFTRTVMRGTDSAALATDLATMQTDVTQILSNTEDIVATGAALNKTATSATITLGTPTATYLNAAAHDHVYHVDTAVAGDIDFYYGFDIGEMGSPVEVSIIGRLHEGSPPSGNDIVDTYAYVWALSSWEHISPPSGDFIGVTNSTPANDQQKTQILFHRHVGTGSNAGLVYIRLEGSGLEVNTAMYVDQIFVSYGIIPPSAVENREEMDANSIYLPYILSHTGQVFYVDAAAGSDGNDGLSPGAAKATIGAAITAGAAGDMIRVAPTGTYTEADITIPAGKNGMSIIGDGARVLVSGASATTDVFLISADQCRIENITVTNAAGKNGVNCPGKRTIIKNVICRLTTIGFISSDLENIFDLCLSYSHTVEGFNIASGSLNTIRNSFATGGGAVIGFHLGNADDALLENCHTNGNTTAGFQVDASTSNAIIVGCSSGPSDGARIDNGTNTSWPDFRVVEVATTDADVVAILADTAELQGNQGAWATATGFAVAGDAMTLADDAITAAKFDETTAFPKITADTGSTEGAHTGADNDTLETLSDQLDTIGPGVGTVSCSVTINDNVSAPITNALVKVSTDVLGANMVRQNYTNDFGIIVFNLNVGTYYLWVTANDQTFTNPTTLAVTA